MKYYFPALDGLRFLASLNIVLLHFSTSNLFSYVKNPYIMPVISEPFFNATAFFVLSGFIYSVMFSGGNKIPKLRSFIKERFMKLYPLHLVCSILIFCIVLYRTNILDNFSYAVKTLALHISLLWAFVPEQGYRLNQPSWTLSVFFICYLLVPFSVKFLNANNKKSTLWILLVTSILIPFVMVLFYGSLPNVFRGFFFFSGMFVGRLFLLKAIPLPKKSLSNDLLIVFATVSFYFFICHKNLLPGDSRLYYVLTPIFYCIFLLLLANGKGFVVKIFSLKLVRRIGKASFYPYLLHAVLIEFLHLHLYLIDWRYNPWNNPFATSILLFMLYFFCVVYNEKTKGKV